MATEDIVIPVQPDRVASLGDLARTEGGGASRGAESHGKQVATDDERTGGPLLDFFHLTKAGRITNVCRGKSESAAPHAV